MKWAVLAFVVWFVIQWFFGRGPTMPEAEIGQD